jgi:peptidoglycan lytic transglycosylase G
MSEQATALRRERRASQRVRKRRRRLLLAGLGVVLLAILAAAALAYRHFHNPAPPPAPQLKTITLTIPEGYDREQTAQLTREAGLKGNYLRASQGHEGFLFPDTFELDKGAPVADLVQLQLEDFKRRVAGVDMAYARSKNLTTHDVVTIASMIEREAGLESQRKLVAAVIYNRLHEGIPLGIDATVRFATGNYDRPLTESELAVDSPYNTRVNAGLPPGPIDSPGLASIEAAAHPAKVGYLYYVTEPGACGKLDFSETAAEFEADVARYNEAREAAGGESPDTCAEE